MRLVGASLKYIKGSCYKLNDVANLIRDLSVVEADMQLAFCERRVAFVVRKLLKTAISNAENNFGMIAENLKIVRIDVGKSFVLKRSMPRGRGRITRIEKRYSKMTILLGENKEAPTKRVQGIASGDKKKKAFSKRVQNRVIV